MLDRVHPPLYAQAVTVTVGGRTWRQVATLDGAGPVADVFLLAVDATGLTHIQFGNGIRGKRPPPGATINVAYRSGGAAGQVSAVAPVGGGADGLVLRLPSHAADTVRVTVARHWPPW